MTKELALRAELGAEARRLATEFLTEAPRWKQPAHGRLLTNAIQLGYVARTCDRSDVANTEAVLAAATDLLDTCLIERARREWEVERG